MAVNTIGAGVILNEGSIDVDFRVESNGNANMLFVDGGNDNVGIGTSSPSLNVAGSTGDIAGTVLHIKDTSARADLTLEGQTGARLDLIDITGGSNTKWLRLSIEGDVGKFHSVNDDGAAFNKDNILVMDLASGKVGIGTTSPASKLDIRDTGTAIPSLGSEGTGLKIARTDGVAELIAGYVATNNGDFYIQTQRNDGATASNLLLNPNGGNVGIGTASPNTLLQVGGTVRGTASIVGTDGASPYLKLDHTATTSGRAYSIYSGGLAAGNFDIYDNTASAARLSIDSSGKVGIGQTTINAMLDIDDGASGSGIGVPQIRVGSINNTGVYAQIGFGWGGDTTYSPVTIGGLGTSGSGSVEADFVINTRDGTSDAAPSERMRVTHDGKVIVKDSIYLDTTGKGLFCNTSDGSDNEQLYVGGGGDGGADRGAIIRLSGNDGGNAGLMYFEAGNVTGGNIKMYVGGAEKFRVEKSSGDIYSNDGSVSSLSDLRVKKDVSKISYGLDEINLLNPVNYKFNGVAWTEEDEVERIGFIYQELVKVLPIATNKTLEEETEYGTIAQTKLIPILVKAVQELSAKVTALENA